jgi:oligopeptide/dipeptide ABC transporter ATP-binding protein
MLLNAIPDMDGTLPKGIKGMPPSFMEDIVGCPFEKRCDRPVGSCSKELPQRNNITETHWCLCGGGAV